jgi:hypothetical protein
LLRHIEPLGRSGESSGARQKRAEVRGNETVGGFGGTFLQWRRGATAVQPSVEETRGAGGSGLGGSDNPPLRGVGTLRSGAGAAEASEVGTLRSGTLRSGTGGAGVGAGGVGTAAGWALWGREEAVDPVGQV